MSKHHFDPELKRRIELVAHPEYEGASLTQMDYILLFFAGIVIPFLLMVWGWIK